MAGPIPSGADPPEWRRPSGDALLGRSKGHLHLSEDQMSIGSAFCYVQLNTPQATMLSMYLQRLCAMGSKGSASTDYAVTHVLGNASPFRVYCSAFHPRRHLRRGQSLRIMAVQERLQKVHSWMASSCHELESKYTYVQSIGIGCEDVRGA